MTPLRILVTGSRDWRDHDTIRDALTWALATHATIGTPVLVHGGQRSHDPANEQSYGADWIAEHEWAKLGENVYGGLKTEAHHANWDLHGRAAGPIRNTTMVGSGAHLCLAFPLGASRGTRGCMRLAERAGIRVINCGDLTAAPAEPKETR